MKTTMQQLARGMDLCPAAKDRAISALVMRTVGEHACEEFGAELDSNPVSNAYHIAAYADEDDNPTAFMRMRRAGLAMRLHI